MKKLKNNSGATILMALLLILLAMAVGAAILTAAVSAAHHMKSDREAQQNYLTVSSAAELIRDGDTAAFAAMSNWPWELDGALAERLLETGGHIAIYGHFIPAGTRLLTPELAATFINDETPHTRVLLNQADTAERLALGRGMAAMLRGPVCLGTFRRSG